MCEPGEMWPFPLIAFSPHTTEERLLSSLSLPSPAPSLPPSSLTILLFVQSRHIQSGNLKEYFSPETIKLDSTSIKY